METDRYIDIETQAEMAEIQTELQAEIQTGRWKEIKGTDRHTQAYRLTDTQAQTLTSTHRHI